MSETDSSKGSREDQKDFDVVVVGAGNTGLVAALSAHEAGARVLVLEAAFGRIAGREAAKESVMSR